MVFIQVALNGDRRNDAVPKTPDEISGDADASVKAGAQSVHVHAYDDAGRETLNAAECGAVVRAIRARCPDVPISLTTSAAIVPDPICRLAAVQSWTELPDLVTANQGEEGIVELSEWLMSRGVEIEAGLLSPADARKFVGSPLRDQCRRVLIEALDHDPANALHDAAEMEAILSAAGITLQQVHHGFDGSCWTVNERALARGHGIRTGMEDVSILPDGQPAKGNVQLVEAARLLIDSTARIPDGFVPYSEPSPFLSRIGPLYERSGDAAGFALGLLVLEHHCNRRGFAHGGLLVTLADIALGKTGEQRSDPPASLLTASLAFDFIGIARRGEWIEARCDFTRVGRELAFANCYLMSGAKVIGRASGVFKVAIRQ